MARRVIQESGLEFDFPAHWSVRKYDSHRFYKGLSSVGLKAVDFIVLPDSDDLWLIEVKNYQPRVAKGRKYIPEIKPTEQLADSIHQKFRDSLRAVRIIYQYYQRNWFFRIIGPYLRRASPYTSDWQFWQEAYRRGQSTSPPKLLIWIELDADRKSYRTRFFATLLKHFQGEAVQLEMGFEDHNPLPGLRVRWPQTDVSELE